MKRDTFFTIGNLATVVCTAAPVVIIEMPSMHVATAGAALMGVASGLLSSVAGAFESSKSLQVLDSLAVGSRISLRGAYAVASALHPLLLATVSAVLSVVLFIVLGLRSTAMDSDMRSVFVFLLVMLIVQALLTAVIERARFRPKDKGLAMPPDEQQT